MRFSRIISTLILVVAAAATYPEKITFNSSGTQIVGFHYRPALFRPHRKSPTGQSLAPVIVMGHGLAALQTSKLQPYAVSFAEAGYHAVTFDYRHWGKSDGLPRNIVDISLQQDDYRAAVAAVKKIKGVDPDRIVIWGTSLSGGTVLSLGPGFYNDSQSGVVGVISQVPHTNGPATASLTPQDTIPHLVELSINDTRRANTTQPPIYVPVANYTGQYGLLTQAGALDGYLSIQPRPPGPEYSNIAARFIVQLPLFSPDATAFQSRLPTYIAIGTDDNIVSPQAAIKLAAKMPNATTYQFQGCGHFDVYPGKSFYKKNLGYQLAFLKKFVPLR